MIRSRAAAAFGGVALAAWTGEVIFLIVNAHIFGSVLRSARWSTRFLTDWSGLLVATVATAAAFGRGRLASPGWLGLATVATMLVGTMFAALGGWTDLTVTSWLAVSSVLTHVVVPWGMAIAWLTVADHGALRWRDAAAFMLFPLAYLVQMFGRAALGGGYPYREVDVTLVGWSTALSFAAVVTSLFYGLGLLLVWVDGRLARATHG